MYLKGGNGYIEMAVKQKFTKKQQKGSSKYYINRFGVIVNVMVPMVKRALLWLFVHLNNMQDCYINDHNVVFILVLYW